MLRIAVLVFNQWKKRMYMHYFVMVLVPADTEDVMQAVADLMEPFNHWKEVERSKRYLEDYEIQEMADHYGLSKIDLPALAQYVCEYWERKEGGLDEQGLFMIETYNPNSHWDYWAIGGRWDGVIQGKSRNTKGRSNYGPEHEQLQYNICPVRELPENVLPEWILTPDGKWYEQEMRSLYPTPQENEAWRKVVQPLLEQYQDCFAVGVDCHL